MTTRKTIALTRRAFVGKGMSLLFNMLSRLVITFLPRSKHLFMCLLAICMSSLEKCLFSSLGPFFDWVIYFSGVELQELLVYFFETNSLSVALFAIISPT